MQKAYYFIKNRKQPKKRPVRLFILIIAICFLSLLAIKFLIPLLPYIFPLPSESAVSVIKPSSIPTPFPSNSPIKTVNSLGDTVQGELEGTYGSYGVAIKNLKTDESYYFNEHTSYNSASLYKLWVMAVVYEKVKEGALNEDDVLSEDVATLNEKFEINPDEAEQTEGTITYSVNDALNEMITISDNYAALLLTEKIGLSSVASWLRANGFNESMVGTNGEDPATTASDTASFFEKLYKGELTNDEYTQKMIDLLKAQALNEKIPKYLPENIDIAHKTGELGQFTHDAGIVYTPGGDYVIVVLSESDNPPSAGERIALVSQAVYQYFTKKQL